MSKSQQITRRLESGLRRYEKKQAERELALHKDLEKYRMQFEATKKKLQDGSLIGRDLGRDNYLRKNYGISLQKYRTMLLDQEGLCAICRQPEVWKIGGKNLPLAVDHDHHTGRVRGLLCSRCNLTLAWWNTAAQLRTAAAYLDLFS